MPFLKVALTDELHRELKVYCANQGLTVKDFVSQLVQGAVGKKVLKLKPRGPGMTTMSEVTEEDLPEASGEICGKPLGVNAGAGVCQEPAGHPGRCPKKAG